MDLALHGISTKGMSEPEFEQWSRYARRRLLPITRIEIYLAQIAMLIVRTMGGSTDAKTADFMIRARDSVDVEEDDNLEAAKQAFGFNPRPRRASDGA